MPRVGGLIPALRAAMGSWPHLRTGAHPAARTAQRKIVGVEYHQVLSASGVYAAHRARPWPVDRAVLEAFDRTVWVFKSVQLISGSMARLPFRMKAGEDDLEDHPLCRVLNKRANPLETGPQFRKRLGAQVLLSKKGAFVEVTKNRRDEITRVDLLPPGRTTPVPSDDDDPDSLIRYYEVARLSGEPRRLDPEQVRWIRDPHPLDCYSGITPLESAGTSIELDVFTRAYNAQFARNDGRPGGVLALEGDVDEDDQAELEAQFEPGLPGAGRIAVVTGGKVTYVDTATRPRDMQYQVTARTAKEEILTAFGIGESVIGNASGRTWDNAEQEAHNFWTLTMPAFLDLIVTGFDEDSTDDLTGYFDTSSIEVLQRGAIRAREEARTEVNDGLRSIDEYRELAGLPRLDTPQSRALYIGGGRTPIPANDADAVAFGLGPAVEEGAPGEQAPPQPDPEPLPLDDDGDGGQGQAAPAAAGAGTPSEPEDLLAGIKARLRLVHLETKQTTAGDTTDSEGEGGAVESVPDTSAMATLESAVAAALAALSVHLLARTAARLHSTKTRKHTRHWIATLEHKDDGGDTRTGQQVLDASRVVDAERWQQEAQASAAPLVTAAALAAAAALLADFKTATTPAELVATSAELAALVAEPVAEVLALVGASAAAQATRLAQIIADADGDGLDLEVIIGEVNGQGQRLVSWAALLAAQVATATVNGARDAAALTLTAADPHADIVRVWRTRADDRVRASHVKARGQTQHLGMLFAVGTALLRYPGDPLGPDAEVCRCRCWLIHRSLSTGRFVPTPAGEVTRRAG